MNKDDFTMNLQNKLHWSQATVPWRGFLIGCQPHGFTMSIDSRLA
jgi:hypothetical protein